MAQEDTQTQSSAPGLHFPRREQVVDGTDITFSWEPADEGREYRVQVAEDPSFENLVLEQGVGERTSLNVTDAFATDGTTYYWRVLVRTEDGWRGSEGIESFVSVSSEEAERPEMEEAKRPDEDEDLGPPGGLVAGAAKEAAAEVTGDEDVSERIRREREIGVAEEGIESGQILAIVAAVCTAIVLIVLLVFFWTDAVSRQARDAVVGMSGYPELRATEMEAEQRLGQYDVIDAEEGVYQIPIDRAMELVLQDEFVQSGRDYSEDMPLQPRQQPVPPAVGDDGGSDE